MSRALAFAAAFVVVTGMAASASADTVAITNGNASLYWDGSLTSFTISSADSRFVSEYYGSAVTGFSGGATIDFSTTIPVTNGGNHPLSETYRGQTFPESWVSGSLAIAARTFVAPHANGDGSTFQTFTTTFTMTGTITAYATSDRTGTPFFSTNVTGGGTISATYRVVGDSYTMNSGAETFTFTEQGVPPPWTAGDVGAVGRPGSATEANGTFTVSGAGSDIWGAADSFMSVTQPLGGDGTLVARVVNEQNTHVFAKAGIQFGALNASSARVILDVKPDGGIEFMARLADGASMSFLSGAAMTFPVWLRLARTGDRVDASVSSTGQTGTWNTIGSVTMTLPASVPVGLAVTSHDTSALNTATFDHLAVAAASPTQPSDIVIDASDVADAALHGAWTKASDPTSPNGVKLATADAGFASTTTAIAAPTHYFDVTFTAAAGTSYTLWLRLQASGNSKFNDSVWVQYSDGVANGASVYPIGSSSALLVNLATDSTAASLDGWGWQNTAYWLSQATRVSFATSGTHTLRVQVREDGVQLDQIVLSPARFAAAAPGGPTSDATIVPK